MTILDIAAHGFYELSTLHARQVARATLVDRCTAEGTIEVDGQRRAVRVEFVTHVLVHQSGFLVLRPTAPFDRIRIEGGLTVAALHAFERTLWRADANLEWRAGDGGPVIARGWGRNFLNAVFLDFFARWQEKPLSAAELCERAVETVLGCAELHRLRRGGLLDHPFPVTFGAEIQIVLPYRTGETYEQWALRAQELATDVLRPLSSFVDVNPVDMEPDSRSVCWFFDENRALTVVPAAEPHPELSVIDADRTQIVEYLTIRRGALNCVRRATQMVLAESEPVARQQVLNWQYLVTSTTDDYVVDARIAGLLEVIRVFFAQSRRLRSMDDLEQQVRRNLEVFQIRIDAAAQWTGGLIGALVGAAALVIGLQDALALVVGLALHVPVNEVSVQHVTALVVAQLALVTLTFVVCYLLVHRLSNNLRPVRNRRRFRLR